MNSCKIGWLCSETSAPHTHDYFYDYGCAVARALLSRNGAEARAHSRECCWSGAVLCTVASQSSHLRAAVVWASMFTVCGAVLSSAMTASSAGHCGSMSAASGAAVLGDGATVVASGDLCGGGGR
jgi:hypothetical protein